ncbi:MAG TPA: hypothetical protein VGH99_20560 [Pseudonocardia sp.]
MTTNRAESTGAPALVRRDEKEPVVAVARLTIDPCHGHGRRR